MSTSRYLMVLSLLLHATFAHAKILYLKEIDSWSINKDIKDDGTYTCRAVSHPYKTKIFDGIRSEPWVALTFVHKGAYTFSCNVGIKIKHSGGVVLQADNAYPIVLKTVRDIIETDDRIEDQNLLNNIMGADNYFIIHNAGSNDIKFIDYYSNKGLQKVLTYMNSNCAARGDR